MKFVLFGGGLAGWLAAEALAAAARDQMVGIVWDAAAEGQPTHLGIPILSSDDARGSADILLCSGYGAILKPVLLDTFADGAFNVHPSLLPSYRGRHAIQWAIAEGETTLGVSLHRMTKTVDEGDVLLMRCRHFALTDQYPHIAECLAAIAADMLVEFVELSNRSAVPPPMSIDARIDRYYRRRVAADNQIDWTRSSAEVLNCIRATAPAYPANFQGPNGQRMPVTGYLVGSVPGEVLVTTAEGCLVATGDGTVWIACHDVPNVGDILK